MVSLISFLFQIESQLDKKGNYNINRIYKIAADQKRKRDKNDVDDQLFRSFNTPKNFQMMMRFSGNMELRGINSDFYRRKLKSEIRRAIVRIVDEYDIKVFSMPSSSSTPLPSHANTESFHPTQQSS